MRIRIALATLGGLAVAFTLGPAVVRPMGFETTPITLAGDAQRGAYLARAAGCITCHTDSENAGAALAGGAAIVSKFGTFYPPNLTTDPLHGIGGWSIEQFAKAVRQGISPEGDSYYPAFSFPFYADMSDQDIADLWSAFQTVPAVAESPPPNDIGFPYNQRWGLKLWRAAYLDDPETEPVSGKSDAWNRGRELVQGVAHCSACHTPRNFAGARKVNKTFAGNDDIPNDSVAPSIESQRLRDMGWTVANLAYALRTGITPSGDAFGGSMAEVMQGNTRFLTQSDLEAMAVYLLDNDNG